MPQGLADLLLRGRLRAVLARLRGEASACQEPAWQRVQLCKIVLACCKLLLGLRAAYFFKAVAADANVLDCEQGTS